MNTYKSNFIQKILLGALVSSVFLLSGCNSDSAVVNQDTSAPNAQAVKSANKNDQKIPNQSAPASSSDNVVTPVSRVTDAQRQEYLDAINAARAETQDCGSEGVFDPAPALVWNVKLDNAAYEHSNDMAQSNTFSHDGSGTASDITDREEQLGRGSKFYERIRHHGYTAYRTVGENIAAGYISTQEVIDAWLKSDHHCANLMNPNYTEVGMSLVKKEGSEYGFYWSQEFGGK
jgi:uncharacterized protein YkwD